MKLFLQNDVNKKQLCHLLQSVWSSKDAASRLEGCTVAVIVVDGVPHRLTSEEGVVKSAEICNLRSKQVDKTDFGGGMTEFGDSEANQDEYSRISETAVQVMVAMQDPKEKLNKLVKKVAGNSGDFGLRVFTCLVDGWTPFHAAVLRGSKKLIRTMLSTGLDVNQRMGQPDELPGECTALHIAAQRGDPKIVEYLLSRGAHINLRDSMDRPPLYYAASSGNLQVVKLLLKYGADVQQSGVNLCDKNKRPVTMLLREFSLVEGTSEHL